MREIKEINLFSTIFYTENKQINKVVTSKVMTYGKKNFSRLTKIENYTSISY